MSTFSPIISKPSFAKSYQVTIINYTVKSVIKYEGANHSTNTHTCGAALQYTSIYSCSVVAREYALFPLHFARTLHDEHKANASGVCVCVCACARACV
jgi:hypothetical protein